MRTLIITLAASLLSGSAWSASVEGVVKEYIRHTQVIVLIDGNLYAVPLDVAIPTELEPGAQVLITTDGRDATKVTAVALARK
ncbi:hypothetical protein ASC75_23865 [Aminobacter sp. DSM 101952]|uniref:DUF1344 domain-containing protein n=1 Tax=Aminobacter sp. DSM 101952 TaxID=2735891 RepID=UPI0006FF164C|nr:DUF1344 domain-containing protein [Aminobacter sp. DSM 101952]KQU72425.1 hypothetical protein ASC75_23865 [Aminobacter sp. DSM 101952]